MRGSVGPARQENPSAGLGMHPVTGPARNSPQGQHFPAAHMCIPVSHPLGAACGHLPGLFPSGKQSPSLPLLKQLSDNQKETLLRRINTNPNVFPACDSQHII